MQPHRGAPARPAWSASRGQPGVEGPLQRMHTTLRAQVRGRLRYAAMPNHRVHQRRLVLAFHRAASLAALGWRPPYDHLWIAVDNPAMSASIAGVSGTPGMPHHA